MSAENIPSKFDINTRFRAHFFGQILQFEKVKGILKGSHYLDIVQSEEPPPLRSEFHFAIMMVNFHRSELEKAGRIIEQLDPLQSHPIVIAATPRELSQDELLLCSEFGVRFVAFGEKRFIHLKDYLKRVCIERYRSDGGVQSLGRELESAYLEHDIPTLKKVADNLREYSHKGEEPLRLLALAAIYSNDYNRAEFFFKRLLQINAQNLWAANQLGRLYLKSGQAAKAIEILRRLSTYHRANSSRLLLLGNVLVSSNEIEEAEEVFLEGKKLTRGQDDRFNEGLAKVNFAKGENENALKLLGSKGFSLEVISFLNMRAIMAMRSMDYAQGMDYYTIALAGSKDDQVVKAKIYFNMALGCVRFGQTEMARDYFQESVDAGKTYFDRAKGPLEIVKAILERDDDMDDKLLLMDEVEFIAL